MLAKKLKEMKVLEINLESSGAGTEAARAELRVILRYYFPNS